MSERALLERPVKALQRLGEALGLGDQPVIEIDLHADLKNIPTVRVVIRLDVEKNGRLCDVVKRYQLVEAELEAIPAPVKFREFT